MNVFYRMKMVITLSYFKLKQQRYFLLSMDCFYDGNSESDEKIYVHNITIKKNALRRM